MQTQRQEVSDITFLGLNRGQTKHITSHWWHCGKCFISQVTTKTVWATKTKRCFSFASLISKSFLQYSEHVVTLMSKSWKYWKAEAQSAFVHCSTVLLEDLAWVEFFAAQVLEFTLPGKVLLHQGFALLAVWVELGPAVWFVVSVPVFAQLGGKRSWQCYSNVRD